jgi:hypothetical protein
VVVPPALIKRSASHFLTLPNRVRVILGLNGYLWVSRPRRAQDAAGDHGDDDGQDEGGDDDDDGGGGSGREQQVPFGGGGGENGIPEDPVTTPATKFRRRVRAALLTQRGVC